MKAAKTNPFPVWKHLFCGVAVLCGVTGCFACYANRPNPHYFFLAGVGYAILGGAIPLQWLLDVISKFKGQTVHNTKLNAEEAPDGSTA